MGNQFPMGIVTTLEISGYPSSLLAALAPQTQAGKDFLCNYLNIVADFREFRTHWEKMELLDSAGVEGVKNFYLCHRLCWWAIRVGPKLSENVWTPAFSVFSRNPLLEGVRQAFCRVFICLVSQLHNCFLRSFRLNNSVVLGVGMDMWRGCF